MWEGTQIYGSKKKERKIQGIFQKFPIFSGTLWGLGSRGPETTPPPWGLGGEVSGGTHAPPPASAPLGANRPEKEARA